MTFPRGPPALPALAVRGASPLGGATVNLASSTDHTIIPVAGSARSLDGSVADLTKPLCYPVEALCAECGQPARCDRWLCLHPGDEGEWHHIERFTLGRTLGGDPQ